VLIERRQRGSNRRLFQKVSTNELDMERVPDSLRIERLGGLWDRLAAVRGSDSRNRRSEALPIR
jgi:hypothetical protein